MADLSNLARLATNKPEFVASKLAAYQLVKQLIDAVLAAELGCSVDDLTHLRLCALPRFNHFQTDIERIAEHTHANPGVLAQILRC